MRPEEPVARIMTETVVVIDADRPVSEALDCFQQYPIHHLPVVRDRRLVGMLSSADLIKLEFFAPKSAVDRARFLDERFRIDQIMRTPVTSRRPSASVEEVSELIIDSGVHAVPIVDESEQVIGIVSTTDIIRSLLRGPPRRGVAPAPPKPGKPAREEASVETVIHRRPTAEEYATARQVAETLHVEARDPKFLGKSFLYLDQRRDFLERVLERADRFLVAGQDEHNHALLLKAILAAKRAEEHATGAARVPFPLE
ncbi:MAG TPA: CBS domain-containing protein [Steroidobacteraceae bacterium]